MTKRRQGLSFFLNEETIQGGHCSRGDTNKKNTVDDTIWIGSSVDLIE